MNKINSQNTTCNQLRNVGKESVFISRINCGTSEYQSGLTKPDTILSQYKQITLSTNTFW